MARGRRARPSNDTTLAIEIIMAGKGTAKDKKAEENGAFLAALLLQRHDLGVERLYTQSLDGAPGQHQAGSKEELPVLHPLTLGTVQGPGRGATQATRPGARRGGRGRLPDQDPGVAEGGL